VEHCKGGNCVKTGLVRSAIGRCGRLRLSEPSTFFFFFFRSRGKMQQAEDKRRRRRRERCESYGGPECGGARTRFGVLGGTTVDGDFF